MLDLAQNIEVRECAAVRECSYERGYVLLCVCVCMYVCVCVCVCVRRSVHASTSVCERVSESVSWLDCERVSK